MPLAFALFPVAAVVFAAAHARFWQRAHETAWVAAPLILVLTWLLLRRSRVVWWLFAIASGSGLVTSLVHLSIDPVTTVDAVGGLISAVQLALLLSPPMRRFVRFRGRLAPG